MDLPNIKLTNPSLEKFTVKSNRLVEELTSVEKTFIVDGNPIKGFINETRMIQKDVETEVSMAADHISQYDVAFEPKSQRLAIRYWYGFFNNGMFVPSTRNESIVFNGAGYRAAGFGPTVSATDVLNAIMKYQKITGTIVS